MDDFSDQILIFINKNQYICKYLISKRISMKIRKIQIQNFRLLKYLELDLEDELSLIVGKNNTGKTSVLSTLNKFLNWSEKTKIVYDDLNIDFQKELEELVSLDSIPENYEKDPIGIKLWLFIECHDNDDLSNISKLFMDLDPDKNYAIIGLEYLLFEDKLIQLRNDYREFSVTEKERVQKYNEEHKKEDIQQSSCMPERKLDHFLKKKMAVYFTQKQKTYAYDLDENKRIIVDKQNYNEIEEKSILKNILNLKYINAKRDVSNKDIDKTLSTQTSLIYEKIEKDPTHEKEVEKFKDELGNTDVTLSKIYETLFKDTIGLVKKFGGISENDSIINILSTLEHRELLKDNTTVVYDHDGTCLPEYFNGLGYMNLISMIFEIEVVMLDFMREKEERPADINLLFIEEPEAHTHPQMQYVFIQNIKEILDKNAQKLKTKCNSTSLQYIISTHSSHIVSKSDFNDIKYFKKEGCNEVISKNIKDLERAYKIDGKEKSYRFLKQYLTLNKTELFFADKAIFIEGDTERILLPAMMKKIDQDNLSSDDTSLPLLSQNISIVEVGNYSQVFEKFIDFIGIKSLIITDIDAFYYVNKLKDDESPDLNTDGSVKQCEEKCTADNPLAQFTSNYALNFYYGSNSLFLLKSIPFEWRSLIKPQKSICWINSKDGCLLIVFQTEENVYHARSFEDAFFHINEDFIIDNNNKFDSLINKHLEIFKNSTSEKKAFDLANNGVTKKPALAIEILLNSTSDERGNDFINWEIPAYIKEGLLWLKQE